MYGNLIDVIKRVWAGYPGGYKKYARGNQPKWQAAPFQQPTDPNDLRSKIPPLGHREYWYPALPDKDIKWNKPQVLRMLGEDLVFFRGQDGQVKALKDACPHRGAYLSLGDCFYKGFVTCPYHGATFDGEGNCVAFLTEGPDSKMVGQLKAWPSKTVTLKGTVFVWMGEGEPVDPTEDIPPEFFEEHHVVRWACQIFHCNWILVLENTNDAHNAFYVHRNCISVLRSRLGGRPRTPLGYRTKIINGKTANYNAGTGIAPTERYYYDEDGNIPYQMYYPGVDGVWPLHRWRLLWTWMWRRKGRKTQSSNARWGDGRNGRMGTPRGDDEWQGTRLPGISAKGTGGNAKFRSHRWAVPVERDMTRIVYLNIERYAKAPSLVTRVIKNLTWPWRNWSFNYNFRFADYDAERSCQYHLPEYLSATDSTVVVIRKVMANFARGVKMPDDVELDTPEEQRVTTLNLEAAEAANSVHAELIKEGLTKSGLR